MARAASEKLTTKAVPRAEWLTARTKLLEKEKEFTRLRDELSRQRREILDPVRHLRERPGTGRSTLEVKSPRAGEY